jgi:KipI family sensor histidine kinase inhibitor
VATYYYASDRSLLIRFGETGDVARIVRLLESDPVDGVVNLHPAYDSVLVVFDAVRCEHTRIATELSARLAMLQSVDLPPPKRIEIPVRYGGSDGPDLEDVAALLGLTPKHVIELHASAAYTVSFLGFSPGFAYLAGLPRELATPRLEAPRPRVPAGSVGIAGNQTAVYPSATPGGWRLIGRTSLEMFRVGREPVCLVAIGDMVRFVPDEAGRP